MIEKKLMELQKELDALSFISEKIDDHVDRNEDIFFRYNSLIEEERVKRNKIKALESEIKNAVEFDGENKKIFEDILTVKVDKKETVEFDYEENQAVDYCLKHELYQLLTVKKSDFEKMAEALSLPFVKITNVFGWKPTLSKTKLMKFDFNPKKEN